MGGVGGMGGMGGGVGGAQVVKRGYQFPLRPFLEKLSCFANLNS